jgi:hypothetical protein
MCLTMKEKLPGSREYMLFFKQTVDPVRQHDACNTIGTMASTTKGRCFNKGLGSVTVTGGEIPKPILATRGHSKAS